MKKLINFSDATLRKVAYIMEREGYISFSSAIVAIISGYYDNKYFTKWKNGTIKMIKEPNEPKMTPEQRCEEDGNMVRVRESDGVKCCFIGTIEHGGRWIPLSAYK